MSIIRRKVHKIRIDYLCSKCGGKMIFQRKPLLGDKGFFHKCDMCELEMFLGSEYPHFQEETGSWWRL